MGSLVRLDDHRPTRPVGREPKELGDGDLLAVVAVLWLASLIRVILAFVHREVFGTVATLALLCVLFLPWLCLQGRGRRKTDSSSLADHPRDMP